jgi:hypothetical protein
MPYFEIPCHFPAEAFFAGFLAQKIPCREEPSRIRISLMQKALFSLSRIVFRPGFDFLREFSPASREFREPATRSPATGAGGRAMPPGAAFA